MKVATVSIAGERRVGQITSDGRALAPFDLPISEAQDGILALIRRNGAGLPPTLSPVPLNQVAMEAPIPQPRRNIFCVGKNYHEHAHEFARSGFDSSSAARARCPAVRSFSPRCPKRSCRAAAPWSSIPKCRRRSTTRRNSPSSSARAGAASAPRTHSIMSGATPSSTT